MLKDAERVRRVPEHGDPRLLRKGLVEQLQTLAAHLGRDTGHAGDITSRAGQALDKPGRDRVTTRSHNDGNHRGRPLGRERGLRAGRDDQIHLEPDELGGERGEPLQAPLRAAGFETEILPVDVAELAEPPQQGFWSVPGSCRAEIANPPHLAGRLRADDP